MRRFTNVEECKDSARCFAGFPCILRAACGVAIRPFPLAKKTEKNTREMPSHALSEQFPLFGACLRQVNFSSSTSLFKFHLCLVRSNICPQQLLLCHLVVYVFEFESFTLYFRRDLSLNGAEG